jgi:hypothetical protein
MVLHGHYPVILACNGKPRILLDEDAGAWLRRLVVLSLKTPTHARHFGKCAELILKTESVGILNWLLEGRAKLAKDKLQLVQTPEQKERAATLLLASDSPSAFVRSCLVKKRDEELGVVDLYEHYQECCWENHLRSFPPKPFSRIAKEEIEITWGSNFAMIFLVKVVSQGRGGRDWRWWRGCQVRNAKLRPVSPWVECGGLQSSALVLVRRFDDLDHLEGTGQRSGPVLGHFTGDSPYPTFT